MVVDMKKSYLGSIQVMLDMSGTAYVPIVHGARVGWKTYLTTCRDRNDRVEEVNETIAS